MLGALAMRTTRMRIGTAVLLASIESDIAALPELDPRAKRINAEEPYRLKGRCITQRLANTRSRIAAGRPHRAGHDYLGTGELLADLSLMRKTPQARSKAG